MMKKNSLTRKERRKLARSQKKSADLHQKEGASRRRVTLWASALFILVTSGAGMIYLASQSSESGTAPGSAVIKTNAQDWAKGNTQSSLELVEYSDFQCPGCAAYFPILEQLHSEFENRLKIVYRHFPIKQIHPHAELAARAAEAAGLQGHFWQMHDMIFIFQKDWADQTQAQETFAKYAEHLGLDLKQFLRDFDSQEVKSSVEQDLLSGLQAGVESTPAFFLNGAKITNPKSYGEFRHLIQQSINPSS